MLLGETLPIVLIVEDDDLIQAGYKENLLPYFTMIFVESVRAAKEIFAEFGNQLFAIVLDGNLPGETTVDLAIELKGMYKGYLVAASNNARIQADLLQHCQHGKMPENGILPKVEVPDILIELLPQE